MERGVATLDIKIAGTVTPRGETVPGKRMSMRKTREVLRLYFELKLRQRQIARSANVSQSTVRNHLMTIFTKFRVHSQAELLAVLRTYR